MIIRKPYAFLIKNFRKIHILLLALCIFIFYSVAQTRSFVGNFLSLGVYDVYNEPISKYINVFLILSIIIILVISVILIKLLRHKEKPWKLYLVVFFEYLLMLIVLMIVYNFFHTYNGSTETATPRLLRDLLLIISIPQYGVFLILLVRVTGVDLAKFNFKADSEYLELSSNDREEIEISIDIDKESFKRLFKRFKRNFGYFYVENKFIVNIAILVIFLVIFVVTYNYVFIVNKIYRQGETLNTNNSYSIRINNSYFTDKDYTGRVISKDSNFVIVDLTIKNNSSRREVNLGKYYLMNGISNYTYTSKTYSEDFKDLGVTYETLEMESAKEVNLILIYKVNKKLDSSRFAMYYQDFNNKNGKSYLRKMQLNVEDVSKIKENSKNKLNDEISFNLLKKKKSLIFDEANIYESVGYSYQACNVDDCYPKYGTVQAKDGYKILQVFYVSNQLDGKDMIDFSTDYGKIKYMDSNGKSGTLSMKNAIGINYYGKYLYLNIPDDVTDVSKVNLVYTVRNNKYTYNLG